ncbi:MAG: DNA polymerase/3'-5' exonuclease PolX [Candidatus Bipolaricaulota bacterium]|nr:DNA polymerase/3'-5' exonuclease PolX [Candidatus Bipolaricaulota bacterium]
MKNALVAKILYEVADLLELQDVPFKPRAYRRAARAVEDCPTPVEDLVAEGRIRELPGVGEAIAEKIAEIVETGKLAYHEELKAALPVDLHALTAVDGVGPKTAKLLYEALGVRTLDDLERAAQEGRIRTVKGLGAKTEEKILRGLEEARRAERRVLLGRALPLARDLCRRLRATGLFARVEPAGSLRRGKETVGDLDLLAISDRPGEAADAFCAIPGVEEVLARGPKKASVRLAGGLQCDLRIVPAESFGAALQYFTGSKEHNIRLRERAVARGLKLSEYGLFTSDGRLLAGEDEAGVYRALGLSWIPPELREDGGEVPAAERGELPRLVELADVQGDLHVHTDASDGEMTLREAVEAARARGLSYLALTDHLKFAAAIPGLSPDDLRRQIEEVRRLNEELRGFTVLTGVEANIARDGSVDVPRDLLRELDLVVASVHTHLRLGRGAMTERLARAVEDEAVDVLGHPTGRLLGERPPCEADWDEVFRRAAKAGTALEVNAHPQRLDLPAELIRRALDHGVRLALGTDAHNPSQLEFLELAVLTARRGWATEEQVLNALPVSELLAARKRGR